MVEIKSRLRKLKDYIKKLEVQEEQLNAKIKELIKEGKKERAIYPLKHKKLVQQNIQKAEGAKVMLNESIANIESAAVDVEVFQALKQGDALLK